MGDYQSTGRFRMKKEDFLPSTSRCFLSLSMWATSVALLFLSIPHFRMRVRYILTLRRGKMVGQHRTVSSWTRSY